MGIANPPPVCSSSSRKKTHNISTLHRHHHHKNPARTHKPDSMSGQHQEYHHPQQENIFAFPPGLAHHDQIRRDTTKIRSGFDPAPPSSTLLAIDHAAPATVDPSTAGLHPVYETAGMLSEMFNNFGPGPGLGSDWYGGGNRQVGGRDNIGDHPHEQQQQSSDHHVHQHHHHHHHHQIPSINADSAAAMQLFLTNPPPRSPSPPQQPPSGSTSSNSTLHMLLPSPSTISPGGGGFHSIGGLHHHHHPSPNPNFWSVAGTHIDNPSELSGVVEGQGLSLSLSSSLQHLDAAKEPQDTHHIMFFNQHNDLQQHQSMIQANLQGVAGPFGSGPGPSSTGQHQVHHLGFGSASTSSSLGVVNVLRNSKYAKPAQELLEEFCSVGRGHLKKSKLSRQNSANPTGTTSGGGGGGGGGGGSSSSTKDPPPLSAADRIEHQRRKVKLLSMLDEVDRRYNNYCEQMQMVVNSFDLVMGYGAATPYTALAQKAMSRHFRCLKDAIQSQLRQSCELLGEKDPTATSGLSKGETPRLKMLEQSLRQQRAFHQMGLMEQEAWRPQRGLPERSVNILRAWLFEHFLHPYPNDADKHLLARQTGLSRNQVSNWFINARVRLWKPMVEEMYQQEAKELEDEAETDINQTSSSTSNTNPNPNPNQNPNPNTNTNTFVSTHNPMPCSSSSAAFSDAKRSTETMTPPDSDPSSFPTINRSHHHQPPQPPPQISALPGGGATTIDNVNVGPTTMIRFGTAAGDVSLTLGLRHAGNTPEKSASFSVRDFGSC